MSSRSSLPPKLPINMPSRIRAYVEWKDQSVFAGEHVECVITFKNVAPDRPTGEQELGKGWMGSRPQLNRQRTGSQAGGFTRPGLNTTGSVRSMRSTSHTRGHRPTLSLSVVPNSPPTHNRTASSASAAQTMPIRPPPPRHGRSLSIMSLGSDSPNMPTSKKTPPLAQSRRGKGHGRSASMQVIPRGQPTSSPALGMQALNLIVLTSIVPNSS